MEEEIEVDQKVANEAFRRGLAQGSCFIEKLEKITLLECGDGDEKELSICFEMLSKAVSRGIDNIKKYTLAELTNFGFTRDYIMKIAFNVIRLENQSPPKPKHNRKSRQGDEVDYEEDFEDYNEDDVSDRMADVSIVSTTSTSSTVNLLVPRKVDTEPPSPSFRNTVDGFNISNSGPRTSSAKRKGHKNISWIMEDKWRLGEKIGSGSFGDVFQCMNDKGKLFAVKRLNMTGHANDIQNLVTEIQLMRQLSHPNIVEYQGAKVDEVKGLIYIFQEWVPGGSVAHLLKRFGAFQVGVVRRYTRQILRGLEYLHFHEIVHRDIKGGNILVDDTGGVKLADFGASTKIAFGETQETATIKGTPYFMAPEVLSQSKYGRKGDIWAVGCTIIQMLTGDPPWKDRNLQGLVQLHLLLSTWEGLPPFKADIPPALRGCMELCFKKSPEDRPTAADLLHHDFFKDGDDLEDSIGRYDASEYNDINALDSPGSMGEDENGLEGTIADLRKQIQRASERGSRHQSSRSTGIDDDTMAEIDAQIQQKERRKHRNTGGGGGDKATGEGGRGGHRKVPSLPDFASVIEHTSSASRGSGRSDTKEDAYRSPRDELYRSPQDRERDRERAASSRSPVITSPEPGANPYARRNKERAPSRTRSRALSALEDNTPPPSASDSTSGRTSRSSPTKSSASISRSGNGNGSRDLVESELATPRILTTNSGSSGGHYRASPRDSDARISPRETDIRPSPRDRDRDRDNAANRMFSPRDNEKRISPRELASERRALEEMASKEEREAKELPTPRGTRGSRGPGDRELHLSLAAVTSADKPYDAERTLSGRREGGGVVQQSKSVPVLQGLQDLLSHSQAYRRDSQQLTNNSDTTPPLSDRAPLASAREVKKELSDNEWECAKCHATNILEPDVNYCTSCAAFRSGIADKVASTAMYGLREGLREPRTTKTAGHKTRVVRRTKDNDSATSGSSSSGTASGTGMLPSLNGAIDNSSSAGGGGSSSEPPPQWDCKRCGRSNPEIPGLDYCEHCAFRRVAPTIALTSSSSSSGQRGSSTGGGSHPTKVFRR